MAYVWQTSRERSQVCTPNMPNYFIVNGPNAAVGHGILLSVMEQTAEYILQWYAKMATNNIKYVQDADTSSSSRANRSIR